MNFFQVLLNISTPFIIELASLCAPHVLRLPVTHTSLGKSP